MKPGRVGGRLSAAMLLIGLLVLVGTWVVALRPFAGIDEFAHVYRAASVAHGEWAAPPSQAIHGTGTWTEVPSDIVRAARPECEALPYTRPSECRGRSSADGYTVTASSAGRYNPFFYAMVGYPSRFFSGATALMAMRTVAALATCLMLFLAVLIASRHGRTRWAAAGVLLSATPVVIYSSAVVAPNALEMASGITLWLALLALGSRPAATPDRLTLTGALLSGSTLVTLRSLGPLWTFLIAGVVLVAYYRPTKPIRRLARHAATQVAAALVLLACAASAAWIVSMKSTTLLSTGTVHLGLQQKVQEVLISEPLWVLQSIAAFPYRDQPTAPPVYACYLAIGLGLTFLFLRHCRHDGWAMAAWVATILVTAGVPAVATLATIDRYGVAWQGRYTLPFSVGVLILMAWTLDRRGLPLSGRVAIPGLCLFGVAQVVSVVHTLLLERSEDPTHGTSTWLNPSPMWIGALAAGAVALIGFAWLQLSGRSELACQPPHSPVAGTREPALESRALRPGPPEQRPARL